MELKKIQEHEPFKANPVNKKILETDRPLGVPQLKRIQPTIPKSPAIVKPKPIVVPEPEPIPLFKANPIKIGAPFKPVLEHKHTEPEEIHLPGLEIREKKLLELQEQLEKEKKEQEKKRKFKAQPLPSDSPDVKLFD
jgi:hypothetical protein